MTTLPKVLIILVIGLVAAQAAPTLKLKFLNIIFRHGDRAPQTYGSERYANDPYLKSNFYPGGPGALTNNGKKREYQLGQMIRNYYGNFLGEIYSPSDIIARSTDFDRTKMSLQLVLAGIYPPAIAQRWNPRMDWQPVVTSTVSEADDSLMIPEECPQFLEEYERVKKLPEVKARLNEFSDFMWSAAELSGKRMETAEDMYYLWHALMAEASMGLELPAWTKDMFPYGPLYNGTLMEYELRNYNDKLKRLNGGMLLKNITESMLESVAGLNKRKMHLLSGHESNIDGLLHVLGVYKPHAPEYSSAIFVELLEDKTEYYVRVQYYLGIPPVTVEQVIPGCTSPCPLSDFIRILGHLIPRDEELNCPKKKDNVANASVWKQLSEDLENEYSLSLCHLTSETVVHTRIWPVDAWLYWCEHVAQLLNSPGSIRKKLK